MTTTAHEDQFTAEPELVIKPYDTASILRRNVADLEIALKQQTERAEAAEAELANLRKQKPVAWINLNKWTPSNGPRCVTPEEYEKELELLTKLTAVYAAPVPAVAAPLTPKADCRACVNRGRVNGLSQETYCDSCVYEWRGWRQNHFVDASKMAVAVNRRCEACAILPCSCK